MVKLSTLNLQLIRSVALFVALLYYFGSSSMTFAIDEVSFRKAISSRPLKGWTYLAEKMKLDGLNDTTVNKLFLNPKMPIFTPITFKLKPKEPSAIYEKFLDKHRLTLAERFAKRYKRVLEASERRFGVPGALTAAILYVETQCGKHTGNELVFYRLARLASVKDPVNLQYNLALARDENPNATLEDFEKRASYLEATFYPEIKALLELTQQRQLSVFGVRGSSAGAFGLAQFLPSSYLRFALDANKNNIVSLYEPEDAIFSVANFLAHFGWDSNTSPEEKRRVILKYNNSDAYADTILAVSRKLESNLL